MLDPEVMLAFEDKIITEVELMQDIEEKAVNS
jgi:hypothetical protein